ncbi:hypothetical protein ACFWUZ_32065 [Streptomyces sp. NPDC058646]|uniref:hypothetical protein n=1 Tax=Streptomyces sp. NPDC058646 TaxID=3346574 RepID=UPI003659A8AF
MEGEAMPAHWKPVDPSSGELSEFAERLRDAVSSNGYAVREITKWHGISRSTVYAVLAGERLPSQRLLEQILMHQAPRRSARSADPNWLFARQRKLEKARRSRSQPPRPPVQLGPVPEQERFAEALNTWVKNYRSHFMYWWPEGTQPGEGVSAGWLQRFLDGRAIPSESGLGALLPRECPHDMDRRLWNSCVSDHEQLQRLALDARRSRRTAREVMRILQGGR